MAEPENSKKTVVVMGGLVDSLIVFRRPLLVRLVALGYRVVACASLSDTLTGQVSEDPVTALKQIGVELLDIPLDRATVDPAGDLKALNFMVRMLRELKPDVVLTYSPKPLIYGTMAAKLARVPRVCPMVTGLGYGLRDYERDSVKGKIILLLYRFAFKNVPVAIFQNNDDLNLFRTLGILKPNQGSEIVNGSGVDIDHYLPAPFADGPITFLLIGRLLKGKGVFEYVEAAKILKAKGKVARFLLAGPYDSHPHALTPETCEQLVASGAIEYLGALKDVRPAIASAHVYVLPSYHEGTPRTVLEAMAMGRPAVVTDAPGCRETVQNEVNGYLVPVRNAEALAQAMERFIDSPDKIEKMGKLSREMAERKYANDFVAKQITDAMGV